jgi:type II secretory pathway component PulF
LPAGLAALADDWPDRRIAARLRETARRLAAGQPLRESLAALGIPVFERLLTAGVERGRAPQVMEDCLQLEMERARWQRELRRVISYPALLVGAALLWLYCMLVFIVPMYASIVEDFGIYINPVLRAEFHLARLGWWRLAGAFLAPLAVIGAIRLAVGRRRFYWLCEWLPIVGPILRWRELIAWGGALGTLIEHQAPLDEALSYAAAGARDAGLARETLTLAVAVRQGKTLSSCVRAQRRFPATLAPLLAWGEQSQTLAEAFGIATEYWRDRLAACFRIARGVLPPLAFGFVVMVAVMMVGMFLLPLLWFIEALSR